MPLDESAPHRWAALAEDLVGLGYWWMDAGTQEIHWSPNMYRIFGVAPDNPPSLAEAMLRIHPDDRDKSHAHLVRSLQGASEAILVRLLLPSGEIRYVEGRNACEYGPGGEPATIYGTLTDVTDRVAAQQALIESGRRYRLLAENTTDMVLCFGIDGVITYASPSVWEVLGWTPEEVVGRTGFDFIHREDHRRVRQAFTAYIRRGRLAEPIRTSFRSFARDGRQVILEGHCRAMSYDGGHVAEFQDVLRDVSEREAIKASLLAAKEDAERASSVKTEFLSNISHELRTPLTAIIGFAELLADTKDLPDAQNLARRIGQAGSVLLSLVNGLLDFSRIEAGRISVERKPTSPSEIAQQCLDLVAPAAEAKGLIVQFSRLPGVPDAILIDPDVFHQILLNLLGNAVKFTSSGFVRLTLAYDAEAQSVSVSVEDSGPGIAPDQQGKLFQRFFQVESGARPNGGAGLGLAICKGLVEALGGSIRVDSSPGEGSIFSFVAPAPEAVGRSNSEIAENRRIEGAHVLVADDNANVRELARRMLESIGSTVTLASGGGEAIEAAMRQPFDLLLIDIRMDDIEGDAVARTIRELHGPNQQAPLVAFTASGLGQSVRSYLQAGFDDVLQKPIHAADLVRIVAKHATARGRAA